MPDTTSKAPWHGQFVWYELMTTDMAAAEAFYTAVIGWSAQDSGHPDMRYTLFAANGASVAGLMTLPAEASQAGARPGWIGYVGVGDVDTAAAGLTKAGGRVHRPPADIPGIGRFAVVADPQEAGFVLFTPAPNQSHAAVPHGSPGHFGWHELYATDWEAAFAFYAGQFGWTKTTAVDMGPMGTYQLFAAGDADIGGMMNKPDAVPRPHWGYYVNVEAIDAAAARITGKGGRILMGPHEVPGGSWIVQALDPQGASFALAAPKR